jgi:hypothetical protein
MPSAARDLLQRALVLAMTPRLICVLSLAGLPPATLLPAQSGTSTAVALAAPGQRVSGTAWTTSAQTWVVLVRGAEGSRLESVIPRAIPVQNPCTGPDTTLALGRAVAGEALVLLAGAGLEPGRLETAWEQPRFLYPGETVPLRLGERWTSLTAYGRAAPGAHDTFVEEYQLVLSHESTKDTIAAPLRFGLEGHPEVRWAGDLDRDGRPDLLADLTTHYAGTRLVLFLSRGAGPGHLVRVAGRLDLPGC